MFAVLVSTDGCTAGRAGFSIFCVATPSFIIGWSNSHGSIAAIQMPSTANQGIG